MDGTPSTRAMGGTAMQEPLVFLVKRALEKLIGRWLVVQRQEGGGMELGMARQKASVWDRRMVIVSYTI